MRSSFGDDNDGGGREGECCAQRSDARCALYRTRSQASVRARERPWELLGKLSRAPFTKTLRVRTQHCLNTVFLFLKGFLSIERRTHSYLRVYHVKFFLSQYPWEYGRGGKLGGGVSNRAIKSPFYGGAPFFPRELQLSWDEVAKGSVAAVLYSCRAVRCRRCPSRKSGACR